MQAGRHVTRLGRPLFPQRGLIDLAEAHARDTPDLDPLSADEQRVLLKALAKKPEDRYPSCSAFIGALQTQARGSRGSFADSPRARETGFVVFKASALSAISEAQLERMRRYTEHRRTTQPTEPSVGSIFRNPTGDFAGTAEDALDCAARLYLDNP